MSAAELMAELEADPAFVARRAAQDQAASENAARMRAIEAPLLTDLANLGIHVNSILDLVNSSDTYPGAVPLLFDHLNRPYPPEVHAGVARALAVPAAYSRWAELVERFRSEQHYTVREGLSVAINRLAQTEDQLEWLIALAADSALGPSRIMFLNGIGKFPLVRVDDVLRQFHSDPDLRDGVEWQQKRRAGKAKRASKGRVSRTGRAKH